MGTRSRIGVMHGDKLKSVYCHWDGYLSNNGKILQNHYDSAKANHLVSLGDLSSLGTTIGEKHDFDTRTDCCTFYGRDRDETGTESHCRSPASRMDRAGLGRDGVPRLHRRRVRHSLPRRLGVAARRSSNLSQSDDLDPQGGHQSTHG